jgi:23S rRNA-/tRNA-specific pseudouridylate synthase
MLLNLKQKMMEARVENTPSEKSVPNRDSIKKFYIEPDYKTPVLDKVSFIEFVSQTSKSSTSDALRMIKESKVTVNKEIIVDENYQLESGDVVRVGVLGHFLQGPNNIAIVK